MVLIVTKIRIFQGISMFKSNYGLGQLLRLFQNRLSPCIIGRWSRRLRSAQVDLHAQTSMQHALPPEDFRASQVVSQFRLVRNMAADPRLTRHYQYSHRPHPRIFRV